MKCAPCNDFKCGGNFENRAECTKINCHCICQIPDAKDKTIKGILGAIAAGLVGGESILIIFSEYSKSSKT
jgi:hypothetical protein